MLPNWYSVFFSGQLHARASDESAERQLFSFRRVVGKCELATLAGASFRVADVGRDAGRELVLVGGRLPTAGNWWSEADYCFATKVGMGES